MPSKVLQLLREFSPRVLALVLIGATCGGLGAHYASSPEWLNNHGVPTEVTGALRAWKRAEAKESPYLAKGEASYRYSPGTLALVQYLPRDPESAWKQFTWLSILALGVALWIGARYASLKSVLWLALGLLAGWQGILDTLSAGRVEFLILCLAMAAVSLRRRVPLLSGAMAGTLPWIQLPWLLLLLPLTVVNVKSLAGKGRLEKRVRLVITGYFLACFFWGAAFPVWVFGTERAQAFTRQWIELLFSTGPELFVSPSNQSIWISVQRWLNLSGSETWGLGLTALVLSLFLGIFTARLLRTVPGREGYSWITPWLLLAQLLNPLAWRFGSVFAVGAFFSSALESQLSSRARALAWALFSVAFVLQFVPLLQFLGVENPALLQAQGVTTVYWLSLLLVCL